MHLVFPGQPANLNPSCSRVLNKPLPAALGVEPSKVTAQPAFCGRLSCLCRSALYFTWPGIENAGFMNHHATPGLRPIRSRHNELVKQLRRAFSQAAPAEDGSVGIEGAKLVEEAIRSGRRLRAVFFAESAQERAQGLLALFASRLAPDSRGVVEAILLPDEIFHGAVASESPQGVAALVYPLTATLEELFREGSRGGAAPPAGGQPMP